jgi:D-3-phosphoglycerate dehydrogenase
MKIEVLDTFVKPETIAAAGATPVADLHEALPRADFITLHIPLSSQTKSLIGAKEMALMPKGARIINSARGGIVDEAALVDALRSGHIRGAALDVFEKEPPAADNPLLKLDSVILSPHSAGLTVECAARMAVASVENALAALGGKLDPATVVNRQVLKG